MSDGAGLRTLTHCPPKCSLVNALQHVNREKESVTTNERVQECLAKVKADRKAVVRYIQLVDMDEGGDFIGALIATNEQVSRITAQVMFTQAANSSSFTV